MLTVSELYIYPVKSLAGIAVDSAQLTNRGFQHDRRLMLVDHQYRFLTQREYPQMALLQPVLDPSGLFIHHKQHSFPPLFIPLLPAGTDRVQVQIFDDHCAALLHDAAVSEWFSKALGVGCHLAYMPDDSIREVDHRYASQHEITSFTDGYPTLLIGQASLDDLNARLAIPLPMNRFRPSIVFEGGAAFMEDELGKFFINGIAFTAVKPCARCTITTINQDTAEGSKEPLKTLSSYRKKNNKILFGQNLLHQGEGKVRIGDELVIEQLQPAVL